MMVPIPGSTGIGRGVQAGHGPLDFDFFSKKGYYCSFEWEKQVLPLLPPPGKILEKSFNAPWKNPSDAHAGKLFVAYSIHI